MAGRVEKISAQEGDSLKTGQVVVELDAANFARAAIKWPRKLRNLKPARAKRKSPPRKPNGKRSWRTRNSPRTNSQASGRVVFQEHNFRHRARSDHDARELQEKTAAAAGVATTFWRRHATGTNRPSPRAVRKLTRKLKEMIIAAPSIPCSKC